jgi:hypothetical protein
MGGQAPSEGGAEARLRQLYEKEVMSPGDLAGLVRGSLAVYRHQLEGNWNLLLADVKALTESPKNPLASIRIGFDEEAFAKRAAEQLKRNLSGMDVKIALIDLTSSVGSYILEQIAFKALSGVAARMGLQLVAAVGGAAPVAGATGGAAGSSLGPAGTAAGMVVGLAIGILVDSWMMDHFAERALRDLRTHLDKLSDNILNHPGDGLAACFAAAGAALEKQTATTLLDVLAPGR